MFVIQIPSLVILSLFLLFLQIQIVVGVNVAALSFLSLFQHFYDAFVTLSLDSAKCYRL